MKSAQDWNKEYQTLGSTRDMVEWIAQIQSDARESTLIELNAKITELEQAQRQLDNWNQTQ